MRSLITVVLLTVAVLLRAQDDTSITIQQMVETKNFVFKAESVTTQRGRFRQLTSDYDLVVKNDSVISFLPYFGRAYTAPVSTSEDGIKFTSSHFDYTAKKGKKQRWEITIKPGDAQDVQELYLTVFDNGKATLRVNSINREAISFSGYILPGKKEDKKGF